MSGSVESGEVDGEAFEVGERAVLERSGMGGSQHHPWRPSRFERFLPAGRAQAPAIAGLEAGKAIGGHGGRQVVAAGFREGEELSGHHRTDRVAADVLAGRVAAPVAEESRERFERARLERLAEDVACATATAAAPAPLTQLQDVSHGSFTPRSAALSCVSKEWQCLQAPAQHAPVLEHLDLVSRGAVARDQRKADVALQAIGPGAVREIAHPLSVAMDRMPQKSERRGFIALEHETELVACGP